jgi:hypothetical protein
MANGTTPATAPARHTRCAYERGKAARVRSCMNLPTTSAPLCRLREPVPVTFHVVSQRTSIHLPPDVHRPRGESTGHRSRAGLRCSSGCLGCACRTEIAEDRLSLVTPLHAQVSDERMSRSSAQLQHCMHPDAASQNVMITCWEAGHKACQCCCRCVERRLTPC